MLRWKVVSGDYAEVKRLIEEGADINVHDEYGWTVLIYASVHGHTDIARLLIDEGADVNVQAISGRNVPNGYYTLFGGYQHVSIEEGALLARHTALIAASSRGHPEIVKLLIEAGADINVQDEEGFTALYWASNYPDIVELLKEAGDKE